MTNLSEQELIDAGYRKHRSDAMHHADALFQKRVKDGDITKYFINIYWYEGLHDEGATDGWQPEATLHCDGDRNADMTLGGCTSLEDIESFLADVYAKLRCKPDPHN